MANTQDAGTGAAVAPQSAADRAVNAAPPGWSLLYDGSGRPTMVRDEDRVDWELEHGLITERYDLTSAAERFSAAHAAVPDTVATAMEEFSALGYVRDEMYTALNLNMGEFVDAYRWLLRCVGATLPTEAQIANMADHRDVHGSLDSLHPAIRRKFEDAAARYPAEALAAHRARAQADQDRQQADAAAIG